VIKFVSDATGRLFSPGIPLSSTNKTDRHDITEISKVALNIINQTDQSIFLNLCLPKQITAVTKIINIYQTFQ
jgi:hypothetical protein